jgi:exodeoxyribonuclease V alpha subunit
VKESISIEVTIDRVLFEDEVDGFTVAKVRPADGGGRSITAVGHFKAVVGLQLLLEGHWVRNPKYGLQFQVERSSQRPPLTTEGLYNYLCSGLVPGVGPVLARRIVEHFGLETFKIIEDQPERLEEVPGLGAQKVRCIKEAMQRHREMLDVMVFLHSYGVSSSFAHRIYKAYGAETIQRITQDPYVLTRDIFGIGFKKADAIAKRMGIEPTSMTRCRAGLVYVLQSQCDEGHVYLPRNFLLEQAQEVLEVPAELLEDALKRAADSGEIILELLGGEERVYLRWLHEAERATARSLLRLARAPSPLRGLSPPKDIGELLVDGHPLNKEQSEILQRVFGAKVLVVTGGPGTGKTTAMKALMDLLERHGLRISLAAPTGRASKRLSEATGREAKTIHRLLEFNPSIRGFMRGRDRPLPSDVVLVDEASMIDLPLMNSLTAALRDQSILVLVGDVDQLPSVGPGNVLQDIIASGLADVVRLREIFRQAHRSYIVVNAHRVNQGQMPLWHKGGDEVLSDFYFLVQSEPERIQQTILTLCTDRIPRRFGLDPLKDIQVITPIHRGPLGTAVLNRLLQERLNPATGQKIHRGEHVLGAGDKVMQIRNNYEKEVFNGDIGVITRIDRASQGLWVRYLEQEVYYHWSELDEIVLAYAISVHKSQGSEYPAVVMPLVTQHYLMLQRNLLYTAITRARRLVVLVGTPKALAIAVKNDKIKKRYSGLRDRLEIEGKRFI